MSRFDDWTPDLHHLQGSPARLCGIDVYYDFDWADVVTHGMRQFAHGQRLAELAIANARGKTPALILTSNPDELEGTFDTDTHHFVVVCLPRYIREAEPNEAIAYLSRRADVYEARMARLEELMAQPDILRNVLTAEQVADWLSADPARAGEVEDAMPEGGVAPELDPARAVIALSRYWNALAESPELRDALFTEDGAATAFARWAADNPVDAAGALSALEQGDLAAFNAATGIARLQHFLDDWNANRDNANEEAWQEILTRESWALAQLFGSPFVIVRGKAYVGGKTYENLEGRITDFLYRNRLTGNVLLVEIKTPTTSLLAGQYRQVYPLSHEVSGAIAQVLDQRHSLIQNYDNLALEQDGILPFNPRTVVLVGDLERQQIDGGRRQSFELVRNALAPVELVTFDELAAKAEALLALFRPEEV